MNTTPRTRRLAHISSLLLAGLASACASGGGASTSSSGSSCTAVDLTCAAAGDCCSGVCSAAGWCEPACGDVACAPAQWASQASQHQGVANGRKTAGIAFDPVRSRVLMTHGLVVESGQQDAYSDETWAWDGSTWTLLPTTNRPPARATPHVAYDEARQRLVLLGGYGGTQFKDTWELDGNTWTRQATTGPMDTVFTSSDYPVLLYHSARQKVVALGRKGIFEWTGTAWNQVGEGGTAPLDGEDKWMVYEPRRNVVVLVVGSGAGQGNTWEWDGTAWMQRMPATRPGARNVVTLVHHAERRRTVLVNRSQTAGETWEYDGNNWALNAVALSPDVYDAVGTYDRARQKVVMVEDPNAAGTKVFEYGP